MRTRLIADVAVAEMLFSQIHHYPQETDSVGSPNRKAPAERSQKYGRVEVESADGHKNNVEIRLLPLEHLSKDIVSAFTTAAQLLVDFSCFPMYCTDQQKVFRPSAKKGAHLQPFELANFSTTRLSQGHHWNVPPKPAISHILFPCRFG